MARKEKSKMEVMQYTKYEAARIIGARALQISMNAPILLALKKDELEKLNYDTLKIAEIEFKSGILPITVKRPFPKPRKTEEEIKEEAEGEAEEKKVETPAAEPAAEVEGEEEKSEAKAEE